MAGLFRELACLRALIYLHGTWADASILVANMHIRFFQRFSPAGTECTAIFTGWITYHFFFFLFFACMRLLLQLLPLTLP